MTSQAYLGQRCHVKGVGFGTIIKIGEAPHTEGWLRVEIDAGGSSWYQLGSIELLPTFPASGGW